MSSIEFSSAVLCEEVRREANGKAIIVGAGMVGPELPADQETEVPRIAFYLEAEMVDVDRILFQLICSEYDDAPIEVDMSFEAMRRGSGEDATGAPPEGSTISAALVFNSDGVKFKGPGIYKLQYKLSDEDWQTVKTFPFPEAMAPN